MNSRITAKARSGASASPTCAGKLLLAPELILYPPLIPRTEVEEKLRVHMRRILLAAILLVVPATQSAQEPKSTRAPITVPITILDNVRHIYVEPLPVLPVLPPRINEGDHPFTPDLIIR